MLTLEQVQSIIALIDGGPNVGFTAESYTGGHVTIIMLAEWPDNFGPGSFTTRDVRTVAMTKLTDFETLVRICHSLYVRRVEHEANERFRVANTVPFDPHRGLEALPLSPGFALASNAETRRITCVDCHD